MKTMQQARNSTARASQGGLTGREAPGVAAVARAEAVAAAALAAGGEAPTGKVEPLLSLARALVRHAKVTKDDKREWLWTYIPSVNVSICILRAPGSILCGVVSLSLTGNASEERTAVNETIFCCCMSCSQGESHRYGSVERSGNFCCEAATKSIPLRNRAFVVDGVPGSFP